MARKVFISVLGTGLYEKCKYARDNFESTETHFIQSATLEYLNVKNWSEGSMGLFLLTDSAKKSNWDKTITQRRDTRINQDVIYPGLEGIIEKMKLPLKIKPLTIPDGNNEEQIWEVFSKTFKELKDGDELYFDVTHAFRFLPMLILILCNYAKFLKGITLKSITYGNYEARNKETNIAPIIDLLPLSQLQDWTFAAGQYLETGNVDRLVELSNSELKPILIEAKGTNEDANNLRVFISSLNNVVKERQTCRGLSLIKSESFGKLKKTTEKIIDGCLIKPLEPVISKIKDSFADFDTNENIKNGFASAKWCFNNKLYQQAATILQEVVVSFFCNRHKIAIDDDTRREIVNQALILKFYHQENEEGDNWSRVSDVDKPTLADILTDELLSDEVAANFNNLSEVRNDYNHSGMRSRRQPLKPDAIIKNIEKCINEFENLFI
ncbi:MAG: TIGR02221 family CRISPR-associated protein [Bacteroidales bacterium]|nr:TIGR02221 family CRISPR-associated protein [Bacteroidales bacterium]